MGENILKEGRNCWRIGEAERVAFLIDGEAYFSAFFSALKHVHETIMIAAWDIDSRIRLLRNRKDREFPGQLGELLKAVVKKNRNLQAYILDWDFAVFYALTRETPPMFRLPWKKYPRIHMHMDDHHPLGASHHQKIVVMDDRIAFAGGMDLAKGRWDTPEHRPDDPRRTDPFGNITEPVHDVQMLVEGNAAAALGELFRDRWKRATGREILMSHKEEETPWPDELKADLRNVRVGISRTDPPFQYRKGVREVETLYLDCIDAARRLIYIENQYLTSHSVGKALAQRLSEQNGPEVVIVLPQYSSDWLEASAMGTLREHIVRQLRDADRYGRLGIYYPWIRGLGKMRLKVHSKIMVVDDRIIRVGSSNLSNRSMGMDTECDLSIESNGEERIEKVAGDFRNKLVGEHINIPASEVRRLMNSEGSLNHVIKRFEGKDRSLFPLSPEIKGWINGFIPDLSALDSEEPIDPSAIIEEFAPESVNQKGQTHFGRFLILIGFLVGLALAWRFTPLNEWINPGKVMTAALQLKEQGLSPFIAFLVYILGGFFMFPVTLLILGTIFIFGPLWGIFYSLLGCLLSAFATYGTGKILGHQSISRLAGTKVNKISRNLAKHGVIAVTTVRIIPIAPFTLVNMVAGASHIRFLDFTVGTILGLAPGIIAMSVFEARLEAVLREPSFIRILILLIVVALFFLGIFLVQRWLKKSSYEG